MLISIVCISYGLGIDSLYHNDPWWKSNSGEDTEPQGFSHKAAVYTLTIYVFKVLLYLILYPTNVSTIWNKSKMKWRYGVH